jgi:Primase C terminal 2 (PriCT-2)/BT4734-like, N-terminal domain/Protein of unknown function (DUF3987)
MVAYNAPKSPDETPAWGDPLTQKVSVFAGAKSTHVVATPTLGELLSRMTAGRYEPEITHLRVLKATLGAAAYKAAKEKLPAFTPCCLLKTRARNVPLPEKLVSVTGGVHLDFDNVPDTAAVKQRLSQDPSVVCVFTSPSGGGLKVLVAAMGIHDGESYKQAWRYVVDLWHERFPDLTANTDAHVCYLNALCYVSFDRHAYVNPHAVPLVVPDAPASTPPAPAPSNGTTTYATAARLLAAIPNGECHYDHWRDVGMALHSTGQPWAKGLWDGWAAQSVKYDQREQDSHWRRFRADGGITIGTLYHLAKEASNESEGINLVTPPEKSDAGAPHEIRPKPNSSLNSLTSYPWPEIRAEAFDGLAGDFVRAIAPHSEADPAALLAQFVVTFGVVAGRHRYFQVEATQHFPNEFVVVVGATSRARKGTSHEHTRVQMEEADTTWGYDNYIKGCGSGEGLIAAVRDERRAKVPIKEKGRIVDYQDDIVDEGVSDKRGLFYTGEFASIIKVAAREGNTLSEVIRDCWDTGNLRNTVKTNPMRATGAHIGIVGHITIDEVRKLLTTTDLANGFANRFLFVCAKRSAHLLPDGGSVAQVDFTELRARLQAAIAFATHDGRMYRDAQAKAAWHAVYKPLSDDRTGLADTILARAEAHVLRLSMLYALLDCSEEIQHKHLNAALALWTYVEDSAAHVFGNAIGDATADTIVQELEKKGATGITKNAFLEDIFQRNTPAAEITRALHFLEQHGRIVTKKRSPAGGHGRPATVYVLQSYEVNEFNEDKRGRYISLSNDAVAALGIFSEGWRGKYEINPSDGENEAENAENEAKNPEGRFMDDTPTLPEPGENGNEMQPQACLHEHVNDARVCNDCGLLLERGYL